jgi:hypothetical protein
MDVTSLFMAHIQCPLYLIPVGSYFAIDFPIHSYTDIMQKNHSCIGPEDAKSSDIGEHEIYIGNNTRYILHPKSLVTPIDYNGKYWYPNEY